MRSFEQLFQFHLLGEFKDFQQQKRSKAKEPWHRKIMKGLDADHQNQVAKRYKGRYTGEGEFKYSGELNSKIESIRDDSNTVRVLTKADLNYINKNYPVKLSHDKPAHLSNTNMLVYFDKLKRQWFLRKK